MKLYQCVRLPLKLTKEACETRLRYASVKPNKPGYEAVRHAEHIYCRGCTGVQEVAEVVPPERLVGTVPRPKCRTCGATLPKGNASRRYCNGECKMRYSRGTEGWVE